MQCPSKGEKHSKTVKSMWQDESKLQNMLKSKAKTNLNKYGFENAALNSEVIKKTKQTNKEKYGAESPFESKTIQNKIKQTIKNKYGVNSPFESPEIRAKAEETFLKNHGVPNKMQIAREAYLKQNSGLNSFATESVKDKIKKTCIEKYGVEHPLQNSELFEKQKETHILRSGRWNPAHLNISDASYKILNDKDEFKQLLSSIPISTLASQLSISKGVIISFHDRYDFNIIPKGTRSGYEEEIVKFLSDNNIKFKRDDRTICKPYELDFVLENNNLAIEFDGLYWHSEKSGKKQKDYHINKYKLCKEKGIQLITIFEDEWLDNPNLCCNLILNHTNNIKSTLGARKCKIEGKASKEVEDFLNTNHLQKSIKAKINICLTYDNEIVSILSIGKSRYNKQIDWEILRIATKQNLYIIGGIKKLWKYFLTNYNPSSVISYCDKRWFSGNIYKDLNFTLLENNRPSYWYTDYRTRMHRAQFMKHKLVKQGNDPNKTEWEIMQDLGYDKIWDCGQDTWIWKII